MEPEHLSASAIATFEGCESRYRVTNLGKTPEISGSAANLGSACHNALERFVVDHDYTTDPFSVLSKLYDEEYALLFSDTERLEEGREMLKKWHARQDWTGRDVLSCEIREDFQLTVPGQAPIPVTYIWDRCDQLADGSIEVVDYKTVMMPVTPEELKHRVQPRLYGLAAQIKYPDAKRIWVTYDLLRYESVGTVFTRDDNVATWNYLQDVAKRIRASDGMTETLNAECRWCVRKASCDALASNVDAGGIMSIASPAQAAARKLELDNQIAAARNLTADLEEYLLQHMEKEQLTEFATDAAEIKITASSRRKPDSQRIASIIGPEVASRYGTLTVSAVQEILKSEDLTEAQTSEVKQAMPKQFGSARVKVSPLSSFDED